MSQLAGDLRISPSFSDRCKRAFLGRPMINDQLQHERLSNPIALGVLSPDAISSTAYGSEQVMIELLPAAGHGRVRAAATDHRCHPAHSGAGGRVVPPGGGGLHPRRRLVRGRPGKLRTQDRADRRGVAADRLRRHRRGAVRGRDRGGRVGDTRARSVQPGNHRRHCALDVLCQPAWIAGSRTSLRAADVFVCRHGLVDDRRRRHSGILRGVAGLRPGPHRRGSAGATRQRTDHGRHAADRVAGIRERRFVADRRRGDL